MTERTKSKRGPLLRRTKKPDAEGFIVGTQYSEKIAAEIVKRLANGESWMSLANTGDFPSHSTIYVWRDRYPEFGAALRWAREAAADLKADRALEVAEKATSATVSSDRLHYQALMKRAAFDGPERWSDRSRGPAKSEPVEVTFYLRHFERVVGADGKARVREIKPRRRS
ncbi:hypothetical protein [Phenylobacterium sp.]|uniref:terminase small subunit-like protein n=1 Tax=Phenylobacterium sp. TaxID=1871053 RepID=UPI0025FFA570|nr:hypothetical protein [Phenylobacterium sp.]